MKISSLREWGGGYLTDMFVTKLTFVSSWSYHDAADSVCVCVFDFLSPIREAGWRMTLALFRVFCLSLYFSYIYHIAHCFTVVSVADPN